MLDLSEVDNILDALRCLPWRRDRRMVQGDGAHVMATCVDEDTAQAIAAAPRLIAELRDEVVRLRADADRDRRLADAVRKIARSVNGPERDCEGLWIRVINALREEKR